MTKFETGKTYMGTFACDADSHFYYTVVRRTAASVWVKNAQFDDGKGVMRKKVTTAYHGEYEYFSPMGTGYSMAPMVTADRQVEM